MSNTIFRAKRLEDLQVAIPQSKTQPVEELEMEGKEIYQQKCGRGMWKEHWLGFGPAEGTVLAHLNLN